LNTARVPENLGLNNRWAKNVQCWLRQPTAWTTTAELTLSGFRCRTANATSPGQEALSTMLCFVETSEEP
jgi:hypothetical protein